MNAEINLHHITTYQQQLRDQAAAERLSRISRPAARPSATADPVGRTIGAMRRLIAALA